MNRIYISLLTLPLLALPLAAQDAGFSAGGGFIVAPKSYFGSYDRAVNNNLGYFVNATYQMGTSDSNIAGRVSLGYYLMPGKTLTAHTTYKQVVPHTPTTADPSTTQTATQDAYSSRKTSLTLFQVSGDLVIQTSVPNLRGIVGVSINTYSLSTVGQDDNSVVYNLDAAGNPTSAVAVDHSTEPAHHFPFKDVRGLKGGLRLGLEYGFTKSLSGQLLFQQTELAGQNSSDPIKRAGAVNPAWLQVGVSYKF